MPELFCLVASSDQQRADAARVRRQVYCEEEAMPLAPESPLVESSEAISHLLAYVEGEPAGSLRLVVAAADARGATGRFGLELEASFELFGFEAPGVVLAEVTRFCATAAA